MMLVRLSLCLALGVLLAGCSAHSTKSPDAADVISAATGAKHAIGPKDAGRTLTPAVGDTIVFTAAENPSTGYVWSAAFDEAVLEEGAAAFVSASKDPQIVGAGGARTMTFRVKAPGTTTLTLKNARSWESSAPAETVEVKIEAK